MKAKRKKKEVAMSTFFMAKRKFLLMVLKENSYKKMTLMKTLFINHRRFMQ